MNRPKRATKKEKYISWTEEELDKLSEVTPADIEQSKMFVERASPLAAKLLDAKLDEEQQELRNE